MRCGVCGAEIDDDEARFCSRCGHTLRESEAAATAELEDPDQAKATDTVETPVGRSTGTWALGRDFFSSLRGFLTRVGWPDTAVGAGIALLGILCIGAVLLIAIKLQFPEAGAGQPPQRVFSAIVVLALWSLRVPVSIGRLELTALPLGALVVTAVMLGWGVRYVLSRRPVEGLRARAIQGALIGVPFALLCFGAALAFQVRRTVDPIAADAGWALVMGAFWGVLFGALAAVRYQNSLHEILVMAGVALRRRSEVLRVGVAAGGLMLVVAAVLATAAGFIWVIAALAAGAPERGLGAGDAGAAVIYLIAFGPNVILSILAVALGAPIEVGAAITTGGRLVGRINEFSLLDWGAGVAPWYIFLLVLVPLLACAIGGFWARRSAIARPLPVVSIAALTFGLTLAVLGWLGQARLGAGLVQERGFGVVAPHAGALFLAGTVFAALLGGAGWAIGERRAS